MSSLAQHICLNGHLPFLSGSFLPWPSLSFLISFAFFPPRATPLSLSQPSTWPISVCLLSCNILCVLASRYSSVTCLPVAVPLPAYLPPSLLLHVVKTLYIILKHAPSLVASPHTSALLSSGALYRFVLISFSTWFDLLLWSFSWSSLSCMTSFSTFIYCFSYVFLCVNEFFHFSAWF